MPELQNWIQNCKFWLKWTLSIHITNINSKYSTSLTMLFCEKFCIQFVHVTLILQDEESPYLSASTAAPLSSSGTIYRDPVVILTVRISCMTYRCSSQISSFLKILLEIYINVTPTFLMHGLQTQGCTYVFKHQFQSYVQQ